MPKKSIPVSLKRAAASRARGCCEYCRSQLTFAMQSFSVEHIIPRHAGGETSLENLALACEGCNSHKHAKVEALDPVSGRLVPLFHPRLQEWRLHFSWSIDCTRIIGLTPSGRATVEALHLNRAGVVNLRRVLYAMGEHPPPEP